MRNERIEREVTWCETRAPELRALADPVADAMADSLDAHASKLRRIARLDARAQAAQVAMLAAEGFALGDWGVIVQHD